MADIQNNENSTAFQFSQIEIRKKTKKTKTNMRQL